MPDTSCETAVPFVVPAPDLQLSAQEQPLWDAFSAVGLSAKHFDPQTFRVQTACGRRYAYARDDRKFYLVG